MSAPRIILSSLPSLCQKFSRSKFYRVLTKIILHGVFETWCSLYVLIFDSLRPYTTILLKFANISEWFCYVGLAWTQWTQRHEWRTGSAGVQGKYLTVDELFKWHKMSKKQGTWFFDQGWSYYFFILNYYYLYFCPKVQRLSGLKLEVKNKVLSS